jgi:CubicO group peptidase (beta-lactamase class C family)
MTHRSSARSSASSRPTRRTVIGTLGAASLTVGVAWAAMPTGLAASSPMRRAPHDLMPGGAFDRFVAAQAADDTFSGTVLLAHRGRPVLMRAYGMANQQQATPNQPDTIFNLASVTKCFTGLAIAQLAAQGKVAFHEKLGAYVSGFPTEIANVTVHQLLTHTSGVGRPPVGNGEWPTWNSVEETVEGTLDIIRSTPLRFTPGTQFGYSNDGYWLLGAIVAQVSGQSFYDYARQHIFAPAGMTRTDFFTRPQVVNGPDIARPYWTQPSGDRVDVTTTPLFGFIGGPDGGAYSTAPDLLRFANALRDGRLLDHAFTELSTTAKVPVPPGNGSPATEREFACYGFHDIVVAGQRMYGHPGSGPGVATNLDIHPESDWDAIALGNYDSGVKAIVQREREIITQQA